jgi:hypothetical protein
MANCIDFCSLIGCLDCIVVTRIYPTAIMQEQEVLGFTAGPARHWICTIPSRNSFQGAPGVEFQYATDPESLIDSNPDLSGPHRADWMSMKSYGQGPMLDLLKLSRRVPRSRRPLSFRPPGSRRISFCPRLRRSSRPTSMLCDDTCAWPGRGCG